MLKFINQPHATSYYAATVNDTTRHPPLEGTIDADVCVIGAGLTGISAALNLAERGHSVAVLEASKVGWAASGRNGGQLIGGFACGIDAFEPYLNADEIRLVWDMGLETLAIAKERIAKHAIDCAFVPGYLSAANKPRDVDALRRSRDEAARRFGYTRLRYVERDALAQYVQSSRYLGGLFDPDSGHLHPLNYTLGLARAAVASGARIHEDSAVTRIASEAGGHVVSTARGAVRARFVVLACNAFLGALAPALSRKIMPVGTYVIATEPLGEARARALMPAQAAICDSRFALDYFRPTPDARLLWGGKVSYSTLEPRKLADAMRRDMLKTFPQLADVTIEHAWGGFVDITMNRAPHFGRLTPTVYFAQGFSGHGVNTTGLAGKLIAEAIDGQAARFDVFGKIRHRDFPGGAALRMPALVLAMAWYRLRDLL
ncbi:NAD(P)/FAD-dependent oxidoreductase [Burkholderia pseudomallei]|uniref:NAD(P)/FAD-dependent oxidoreductase n=1 Tax=Burkholderia pseudomallei TaxID=28450 RepID=UPI00052AD91A|nr:FAD-binding oxidoreductase [Burkholderia pseudomallei]AIV82069.1 FAD dependent oxidoreductase family protein [Burkholderia pseudomallei MSHR3965]KGU75137.1 FAD binding domain protein [Burkholderia pseudomallei MSHR4304]KGV39991.1 FAD binding domain protein [Burkholderia pseudomallei MSHR4308]KGW32078.1 FAD binding domain protein [Burkholderia pseudomallei MSHR733]KGX46541.1 FAD dependent oxidoreductase family protein [Burkholderia pseudomallei MSHR2138]